MQIFEILKFIQCPDCGGELAINQNNLMCEKCKNNFAVIGGVPVLFAHKNLNDQEKTQKEWFEDHYAVFSNSEYKLERWRQSMLQRIFDVDLRDKVKTYLDIGCGATGYTVIEGAKRNNWISVGADISVEAMVRAKKMAELQGVDDKTAFVVCSAENMPLKKGIFDYISVISILEHLQEDGNAADEVSRLLKETGYVYVCVPNAYRLIWPFLWPFYLYADHKIGHKRHYSINELDKLFNGKNSFKRKKLFYNGHLIKFSQLLLEKLYSVDDEKWWSLEKKDINRNSGGVQLNVIYMRQNKPSREKILLINPPLYFSDGQPKSLDVSMPPLGSLLLASYINRYSDQFQAEIIDAGAEKISLADLGEKIKKTDPFVIAISAMTPQLQGAVELAEFIKNKLKSRAKIFLGGPHISADNDFINRHRDLFDYAITGEAEKTFLESLDRLKAGEEIELLQTGDAIMDLDEVPIPDRSLIKKELYLPVASMLFSRGCPFQCYYCSRPSISRKVRYRSVGNLLQEIRNYQAEGINKINFQDDTFTMNRQMVVDLCRQIISDRIKIEWYCNTRIDLVDDELLGLMKKSGCAQINFGIESGNERVRKEIIHKGSFSNADIFEVFRLCRKNRIKIACYFMIGHPTETEEELLETKQMILRSHIDILGLSIPLPFPGSALYEIAKRDGLVNKQIIDDFAAKKLGEGYAGVYPEYVSNTLDPAFVHEQMKEINRKFYLNFRTFIGQVRQNIFSPANLINGAREMLSLIFRGMSSRKPYVEKKK